jgi:RNA polymerase sigma factor (sigma-70 family)
MTQVLHDTGATAATATLFDRHHARIRAYCLGQLREREEANDAAQSTFLYALAALQRGVAPRNELPWLFTIAHNVCRTRRRSLRRRSRLESGVDIDSVSETIGRDDPSRDDLERLGTSLAALPENQRKALLLREWRGLSYTEVAERMGLTESAVEAVTFRARRSLAQKLRAVDRVASLVGATLFIPGLRRVGSLTGTAKAAAATLAVGVVAGTTIPPLVESGRRTPPAAHVTRAQQAVPRHEATKAAPEARRGSHIRHATSAPAAFSQHVPRYAAPIHEAPPAPSAQRRTESSQEAPAASSDTGTFEQPQSPPVEETATSDSSAPTRPSAPEQRVATDAPLARPDSPDVKGLLPPQAQAVLPDVPVPNPSDVIDAQPPSVPSLVTDVSDELPKTLPGAPDLPDVPTPTVPSLPSLPLPNSPTQSTPLQASQ